MAAKRVFISFDYDNDAGLKTLLAGQAKNSDTPFNIQDFSVKEPMTGDWKSKVRTRIKGCDVVIVLCGEKTHTATGVAVEHNIAKEECIANFMLKGYSDKNCTRPTSAEASEKMYNWTWDNLKKLIVGQR